jgi:hypothetical protein
VAPLNISFPSRKSDIIERVDLDLSTADEDDSDDDDDDNNEEKEGVVAKAKEEAKDGDAQEDLDAVPAAAGGDWWEGSPDRIQQRMKEEVQGRLEKVIALKGHLSQGEFERGHAGRAHTPPQPPATTSNAAVGDERAKKSESDSHTQREKEKEADEERRQRNETEEKGKERMHGVPEPPPQPLVAVRAPTPPPPPPAVVSAATNVQHHTAAAAAQQQAGGAGEELEGEVIEVLDADGENRKLFLRDRAFSFRRTMQMFQPTTGIANAIRPLYIPHIHLLVAHSHSHSWPSRISPSASASGELLYGASPSKRDQRSHRPEAGHSSTIYFDINSVFIIILVIFIIDGVGGFFFIIIRGEAEIAVAVVAVSLALAVGLHARPVADLVLPPAALLRGPGLADRAPRPSVEHAGLAPRRRPRASHHRHSDPARTHYARAARATDDDVIRKPFFVTSV